MKEWEDIGIVLSSTRYGEGSLIVEIFTSNHGRYRGLLRVGLRNNFSSILQRGNLVEVRWRARIEDHLGNYSCDLIRSYSSLFLDDSLRLEGISSLCAELSMFLPERDLFSELFIETKEFLDRIEENFWLCKYCRWEVKLLSELGFSLDLSKCAVTGKREGLTFVSPRSGIAVSLKGAKGWESKLLDLPSFLVTGEETSKKEEILSSLRLTGYFFSRHICKGSLPASRVRLQDKLSR